MFKYLCQVSKRGIRALYDENTITVYQAYNPQIAQLAAEHKTFISPPFKDRMTWIKPSFLWMMYRSGWEWQNALKRSPVRIQWDPEKDIYLQPLPYRSIQIGLSGIAVEKYISEWITDIEDITAHCKKIRH